MTHTHLHTLFEVAESSITRIIRRIEIYESDGRTLWMPTELTPRLVSGQVTVDYDRDERRALDCVLDNSDGVLNHDPNGFWYDKIIKAYRGLEYVHPDAQSPSVAIIVDTSQVLEKFLRRIGFTNITVVPNTDPWDSDRARLYDVVVGAHATSSDMDRIKTAFEAGVPVLQVGFTGTVDPPFIATKESHTSVAGLKSFVKQTVDTPVATGWGSFTSSATTPAGVYIRTINAGTTSILQTTVTSNPVHNALLYSIGPTAQKWFYYKNIEHLQEATVNPNVVRLFRNAMSWLGVESGTVTYERQIGEFMIDRIDEDNFPDLIMVTGRDYAKKLILDKFIYSTSFAAGQSLDSVVRAIATNGGISKFALSAEGVALNATITFDRLTPRWEAIKKLCEAHTVEVFFNSEGYLITRPMFDPVLSPVAVTLKTGASGNLVSFKKSANDSRIRNVVTVTGENSETLGEGVIVGAYVENNEPSSPTRVSRLGPRLHDYSSALFTTDEQCRQYATTMLGILAQEEYTLDFSSIYYAWLEVGEIADFEDPSPGEDEPGRFLLTSLTLPLGLGPMSGTGKRITIVGYAEDRGVTLPPVEVP